MAFGELSQKIRDTMRDAVPTEIQRAAIPKVLSGKNILLIAPTGSGKTEAVILPLLQKLEALGEAGKKGIKIVYITPLRALNRDMLRRMMLFARELGVTVAVRHGDTTQAERAKQAQNPPQMLITTPETFQLLFLGTRLRAALKNAEFVVIDEIHELAEDERGAQLAVALERLVRLRGQEFQRIGLSATVGTPGEIAAFLGGAGREVETVSAKMEKEYRIWVVAPPGEDAAGHPGTATQVYSPREDALRLVRFCKSLIDARKSVLFFVNTRDTAEWLASGFCAEFPQYPVGIHHGSLSKEVRTQMEDDFKSGALKCLICTSSLELGIDVGDTDFVIQHNSPRQATRLLQRVGRAGHRVGAVSEGVIVASVADEIMEAAVIAMHAQAGRIEPTRIRRMPLSVLANQVVAFTMAEKGPPLQEIYDTVRRAHPFRGLKKAEFDSVVRLVEQLRGIKAEGGRAARGRAAMPYFFDNISMIPDEKNYVIRDIATRRPIGTLDENFVATFAEPSLSFIVKGTSWRIVEVRGEEILVEQAKETGALPSWAGEELPVPLEVARGVGAMRRERDFHSAIADPKAAGLCAALMGKQGSIPVADDRTIVIEHDGNRTHFVINACLGTRINETLGRYIAAMLSARLLHSVGVETEPYRIALEAPSPVEPRAICRLLEETNPAELGGLMRLVLRGTAIFRWQFVQSAKKFGAVKKGADYRALNAGKLMDMYSCTPLYEEALGKTLWEKMDLPGAAQALRDIQSGAVGIVVREGISPISLAGMEGRRELLAFGRAEGAVLGAVRERIMRTEMVLACTSCGASRRMKVANAPEKADCHACGSVLVAALRPYEREQLSALSKKKPSQSDRKTARRLVQNANIVMAGGKRAVMALAGRGIGPDTAARLLAGFYRTEDEFIRAILDAELNYAKTRRFWD